MLALFEFEYNAMSYTVAEEHGEQRRQVAAAVALLDAGATVPFIARYRKEATGGLMIPSCLR